MLPSSTKTTYSSNHAVINPSTLSLGMQLNLKQLKLWFSMWHGWQKRIVICRIIENCPKANLELLATSLEPILHLDFSTTLSPLMAALHHEGSRTFRVQRATNFTVQHAIPIQSTFVTKSEPWMKNDSNKELPQISESISHLETIPNSESINPMLGISSKLDPLFLPAIKDTHSKHKVSPASSDLARSTDITDRSSTIESSPLHRSYNSVPNIRSSVDLLNMTKKYNTRKRVRRQSMNRRSLTTSVTDKRLLKHKKIHQLELYKTQLGYISQWMNECKVGDITILLLDIVKMSDKALLGYLVQCLYHRLQVKREIDSLSDNLLLKVFSYLDPVSLLRSRMVCLQWYYLAGNSALWRRQCAILGTRESIGDDLVGAIEAVHRITSLEGNEVKVLDIDWLQAYRDLIKLIDKMKSLVKKLAEAKEREEETNSRPLTSSQLRSSFTLRELLDTVRDGSRMSDLSTQELYRTAPESAATRRRRLRAERTLHESPEENAIDIDNPLKEHTDTDKRTHRKPKPATRNISLLECGIDKRPIIPSLPNPDGIECLILAGFLTPNETPKPGRVAPIPTLGRLKLPDATVLCLECDERKVVAGCSDRLIRVYDIRSGRLVSVLQGHKGSVQCLQFDDHNLVSGSWDTTCIIWDIVHYTIVKVLVGHTDCVSCLQFHSSALVTGSYDHSVKLWDVVTWECLTTIYPAHKKPITCLAFNGLNIFTGSEDKTVKMWDPTDGSKKALLKHDARLTSMVLSKLLLITACGDGEMYLWDLRHMTVIMQWQTAYDNAFASASSIALERGKIYAAASDSMVYEWDIATGTCVRSMQGHSAGLTDVWAGYNRIVTSSEDQTISVWKTKKAIDQGNDQSSGQYSTLPVRVINIY